MAPPETPAVVWGHTYVDETVMLDGCTFVGCTFRDCTLEIGGSAAFALEHCDIRGCEWVVVACAATTIRMLAKVQREYGAQPLIEKRHGRTRS